MKINWILWFGLLCLVLVRLPNLNRPISKHHEYNTAVILINAESWQQADGGGQFGFTPLMNYQGAGNRLLEKGPHIDNLGNHVYLSFGAGWYLLPYTLFLLLGLAPSVLALQLINITISLLAVAMLRRLLLQLGLAERTATLGALAFGFLPGPLWYGGNGYVTTAIMLPLVIGILQLWHGFAQNPEKYIGPKALFALGGLAIALTYIDWLTPFLLGALSLWCLFRLRQSSRYWWVIGVAVVSTAFGIFLVLWQFSQYLGWAQVFDYWTQRFTARSSGNDLAISLTGRLRIVVNHLATALLQLALCAGPMLRKSAWQGAGNDKRWLWWAVGGVLVYNGIFFNWSVEHEFAWLAFGLVASIVVVVYGLSSIKKQLMQYATVLACIVLSAGMYYVINRPGATSQNGDLYAAQQVLGQSIGKLTPAELPIFYNGTMDKIVEYYAKRTINQVASPTQARQAMAEFQVPAAYWLKIEQGKLVGVDTLIITNQ